MIWLLMTYASARRGQNVKILSSSFTNIHLNVVCDYSDHINSVQYKGTCNRLNRNTFVNITTNNRLYGGAMSVFDVTLTVEAINNTFINCRCHSGGAACFSCKNVTFFNNYILRCETTYAHTDTFGSVFMCCWTDTKLLFFYGRNNYYDSNKFYKGSGFDSYCVQVHISLKNETFVNNIAERYGGAVHINNFQGKNDIIDCFFINNTAQIGGGLGYDCPVGKVKRIITIRLLGCYFDSCVATEHGSAIYNYYRHPSVLVVHFSKSDNNKTVIKNCVKESEVMYITSTEMTISHLDIIDNVGSVFVVNSERGDVVLPELTLSDCNFIRCSGHTDDDGFMMSGRFENLTIISCHFNDIDYMWNLPVISSLAVYDTIFEGVDDAEKTSLVTDNPNFTFIYQGCQFIESTMSVKITTNTSTADMNTTFKDCTFENMDRQIDVTIPTEIHIINCSYDGKSNMFNFEDNCRSVFISKCNLTLNDPKLALFQINRLAPDAYSQINDCKFIVNAGYVLVVSRSDYNIAMKIKNSYFDGSSKKEFISLNGYFLLEGNTFTRTNFKDTPVIKFGNGTLIFSKINRNCVTMTYWDTFTLSSPSLYDKIVDSDHHKIDRWDKHNNLCFLDFTVDFTPSQDFRPSAMFSNTEFSPSIGFSISGIFTKTNAFTETNRFILTDKFTRSKDFDPTEHFIMSSDFTKSIEFSRSTDFSLSKEFKLTSRFTETNIFSNSFDFIPSKHFTTSNHFIKTNEFMETNKFSRSDEFTKSNYFSKSNMFTGTKHFGETGRFTKTKSFTSSLIFSASSYYSKSNIFDKSNQFSGSNDFKNSVQFSLSNNFESTGIFSISNSFSSSNMFTQSLYFGQTNYFSKTSVFSPSLKFSKTNKFTFTNEFTETNNFTTSQVFKETNNFGDSKNFNESQYFSPSDNFPFFIEKGAMFTIGGIPKDKKNPSDIGIIIGIILGVLALLSLFICCFIILILKNDDSKEEEDENENNDLTPIRNSTSACSYSNPIYNEISDQDPFETDFVDGETIYTYSTNLINS